MGFEPQIKQILDEARQFLCGRLLDQVPWHERQTCMFTATWPQDRNTESTSIFHGQECKKLAETYIRERLRGS